MNAANLQDAFKKGDGGNLDKVAGQSGAGYDTGQADVYTLISTIIQTVLSFLGVVFLVLMIYGGFMWMTARGDDTQTKKAMSLIQAAIIGMVIVMSAYAISFFVMSQFGTLGGGTTSTTELKNE